MKINLDGRVFRAESNSDNGEVDSGTRFYYSQKGKEISAVYRGGLIKEGHLMGMQRPSGQFEFLYHHTNSDGILMAGKCLSTPSLTPEGKVRLAEEWQWFTGDGSSGESVIVEE